MNEEIRKIIEQLRGVFRILTRKCWKTSEVRINCLTH